MHADASAARTPKEQPHQASFLLRWKPRFSLCISKQIRKGYARPPAIPRRHLERCSHRWPVSPPPSSYVPMRGGPTSVSHRGRADLRSSAALALDDRTARPAPRLLAGPIGRALAEHKGIRVCRHLARPLLEPTLRFLNVLFPRLRRLVRLDAQSALVVRDALLLQCGAGGGGRAGQEAGHANNDV